MSAALTKVEDLDAILALQLTVAWAGEAAGEPARLGWWKSDLVDAEGGGDLFARLTPRTAPWTSLILVRQVAQRVDATARERLAHGDRLRTLFHLGFATDEQLGDRLNYHRSHLASPSEVFGPTFLAHSVYTTLALESWLAALPKPEVTVGPAGREVTTGSRLPLEVARLCTAALLPLAGHYPLAFVDPGA